MICPCCENGLFVLKNISTNTTNLNYDNINHNVFIKIIINQRNKGNKFLFENANHLSNFIKFTTIIILLNLFNIISLDDRNSFNEYKAYNITLKIKGTGTKKIFSSNGFFQSNYHPDEVYINGYKQDNVKYSYELNQTDNFIGLTWNKLINDTRWMFYGCSDIIEIDLSNFNTSIVVEMNTMFEGCSSLISLNLSNFDTSKVTNMNGMFEGCSSLTSLNLSNFDTSKLKYMNYMFRDCTNLEYINMINFKDSSLVFGWYSDIFKNVPVNIVICINKDNINKINSQIDDILCHIEDCTDNWKLKQQKLIDGTDQCIDKCSDNNLYENNGKCYSNCPNGYFNDDNNNKICKCGLEKCFTCSTIALNMELCTKCNDNYYPIENDPSNIGDYFNCYNERPYGYYLDRNDLLYKKCYYTCETCEIKGDNEFHNCLKCNSQFKFGENINNYYNCYENCNYGYYIDDEDNYYCNKNLSFHSEYTQLIENKSQYIKVDNNYIENLINEILNSELNEINEEGGKEEEINKYNRIFEEVESIFTSENYDLTNIDKGEDQIIKANKLLITFTNIENQKNNIKSNMSTIDLGDCEYLLRINNNLTNNQTIYLKKIDVTQDGTKAKKVDYNVYSKLSGNNLEKLNLKVCEDTKILINIPVEINDNIDKLNTSSGYFNDICYAATSNDGTDISLKDRKKEYTEGDNIICQDDCEFFDYDYKYKKAKCKCYAKDSNSSFVDMIINKTKLFENLKDIKNLVNLNILICYKKLLSFISFNGLIHNIGSLIIICIIIFHLFSIFIFYIVQLNNIRKSIKDIIFGITNFNLIKKSQAKNIKKINLTKTKKKSNKTVKLNMKKNKFKKVKNKRNNNIILYNNNYINNNINITTNIIPTKKTNSKRSFLNLKNNSQNKIKMIKNIMNYNKEEINALTYNLALIYDKRSFCQYYNSLLKVKHNLIFSFCNNDDYNSKIIKIDLFFIGFTIYFTVNALFFDDNTMHKIYVEKGKYDFETQIPIALYSSLISMLLNTPLSLLGLSSNRIIQFKQNHLRQGITKRENELNFCLKLKFALFFIISFIFLLFFWYYITMFCIIYKNTQYHLLKDTLISFVLSLLYPFVIFLLPGLFRIPSLSNPKQKKECLYNFSKILQLL